MQSFSLVRLPTLAKITAHVAGAPKEREIRAGGIDLIDRMKEGLSAPRELVELRAIGGTDGQRLRGVTEEEGGRHVGALVTLGQLASLDALPAAYAALRQAAGEAATPGIRNAATVGGNLLQRPRCWYFRHADLVCLKKGGDQCFAQTGDHRYHAILGAGPSWIVHPSSLGSPLLALDAAVEIHGAKGARTIPIAELFVLPTVDAEREHSLAPGEILVAVHLPKPVSGQHSAYETAKEKQSHDWPLAEASVRAAVRDGVLADVRVALGHVAPIPWRSTKAEAALEGHKPSAELFADVASTATADAKPLAGNAYKVPLVQGLLRRALHHVTGIALPE